MDTIKSDFENDYELKIEKQKRLIERDNRIMSLYERWVVNFSRGEDIIKFLKDNKFQSIAVYGYGTLGRALIEVVKNGGLCVDYIIEANNLKYNSSIGRFVAPESELSQVDAVIVTAINDYYEIAKRLKEKIKCPILSLEDIMS